MIETSNNIVFVCGELDEYLIVTTDTVETSIYYVVEDNEVAPLIRFGPNGPKLLQDSEYSLQSFEVMLSVQLGRGGEPPLIAHLLKKALPEGSKAVGLREIGPMLDSRDAAIAARGAAVLNWHLKATFCQTCGSQTELSFNGLSRRCVNTDCRSEHFPRVDTVVITLPVNGDWCLLGRRPSFPVGLYSGFAGFVEPGETLEEASRRETREEAGVNLSNTVYRFSQPWPFPHALTAGFRGQVRDRAAARADKAEISEVRWFRRDEIAEMLDRSNQSDKLRMPGPISLAHQLAREWLSDI